MSGDIYFSADESWSARSSVFAWAVEELAELVTDTSLAEHLREIVAVNLGYVDVAALTPEHQVELRRALRCMPEVGRSRLPDTRWKPDLVRQLEELASHAGT